MLRLDLAGLNEQLKEAPLYQEAGRLRSANGLLTCTMSAAVGDQCIIDGLERGQLLAEVIGFSEQTAYLMPYDSVQSLRPGMTVIRIGQGQHIPAGAGAMGRVIDALGRPIDDKGPLADCTPWPLHRPAPPPLDRARIRLPFITGQRAIDGMLTCGRGQRVGIFAGSGVGKSTLLGEIAKGSEADVNVIALIGERSREVVPFSEDCLGTRGLARSIVVVATCDQSPLLRVRAAHAAAAIADYHRDRGANVLVMIDSLTRLAMAQRDIGLLLGEPPTARGYTPSVFRLMATTIERFGNAATGSVTALLTVLVDGDDFEEPVSDSIRSLVDGHFILDRKIAERGLYPPINIQRSISRVAIDIIDKEHAQAARKIRSILATYSDMHDLIRIGAYTRGASPQIDRAIDLVPEVERFLRQDVGEMATLEQTRREMDRLAGQWLW